MDRMAFGARYEPQRADLERTFSERDLAALKRVGLAWKMGGLPIDKTPPPPPRSLPWLPVFFQAVRELEDALPLRFDAYEEIDTHSVASAHGAVSRFFEALPYPPGPADRVTAMADLFVALELVRSVVERGDWGLLRRFATNLEGDHVAYDRAAVVRAINAALDDVTVLADEFVHQGRFEDFPADAQSTAGDIRNELREIVDELIGDLVVFDHRFGALSREFVLAQLLRADGPRLVGGSNIAAALSVRVGAFDDHLRTDDKSLAVAHRRASKTFDKSSKALAAKDGR